MFDLRFQQIIHTVSFRCLTFISPDLKRFQHETSTTLAATTNSSSHENTLFQRAHARFPLARGGYNNSRQCQSHFRSPTETPVSGLLLETNNKTIKLKCSAFDKTFLAGSQNKSTTHNANNGEQITHTCTDHQTKNHLVWGWDKGGKQAT